MEGNFLRFLGTITVPRMALNHERNNSQIFFKVETTHYNLIVERDDSCTYYVLSYRG
jgi:competence transcription factor ComK